jgi:thiol-disulfide isomerase/thioredoxin
MRNSDCGNKQAPFRILFFALVNISIFADILPATKNRKEASSRALFVSHRNPRRDAMVAWQVLLFSSLLTAGGEPKLVNFTGDACPHCEKMQPVLAQLQQAGVVVQTVNVEQQPEIARQFKVQAIPTTVLLVEGREVNRVVGSTTFEKLCSVVAAVNKTGDVVRGQSPAVAAVAPKANYLSERLNGLFGKGSSAATNHAATNNSMSKDPFADRLPQPEFAAETPAPRKNALPPTTVRGQSPDNNFAERAMAAAVRLKVEDDRGYSLGSGTIIDEQAGEALIMTCGHIFRESKGQGKIMVDLYHPTAQTVEGTLVGFDDQRDIGLVSIRVTGPISSVPVAPANFKLEPQAPVFSIGCDNGQQPAARHSKVVSVQRYNGPPNVQVAGASVDGRSGGGLFSPAGYLVGVCNAADPADDEGIFAALPTLHWQLDKVGLQAIYQRPSAAPAVNNLATEEPAARELFPITNQDPIPELPAQRQPSRQPSPPSENPVALASFESSPQPAAAASGENDTEIICIVRSRSNPAKKNQIFVLDKVSSDLMQQISQASHDPTTRADMSLHADRRGEAGFTHNRSPRDPAPVVRGQSWER